LQDALSDNSSDVSEGSDSHVPKIANSKRNKQYKNQTVRSPCEGSSEDEAVSDEELTMLSKKQRRKLQQKRTLDSKASDTQEEPSPTEVSIDTAPSNQNDLPKAKLKGKKAKEARKQKKMEEALLLENGDENVGKSSSKQGSRKVSAKNIQIDSSVIDADHNCVTCGSQFNSKNKLFDHLKKSGHSVFIPNKKGSSEVTAATDEKKKGKGRRK
jgi:DnaJ family protein A protein 5